MKLKQETVSAALGAKKKAKDGKLGAKNARAEHKLRLDLIPPAVIVAFGEVLTYGALKYEVHNWRKGQMYSETFAAALRHLTLWNSGEDIDSESGLSHLAHAVTDLAFLIEFSQTRPDLDDRYRE